MPITKAMLPRRPTTLLFLAAQFVAGLGFIFSSLWLRHDFHAAPKLVSDVLTHFNPGFAQTASISSRVLKIPQPGTFKPLELNVETQQFRFELPHIEEAPNRKIASKGSTKKAPVPKLPEWGLTQISRQLDNNEWEDVSLVRGEGVGVTGSIFVELNEGVNLFRFTYQNRVGKTRNRTVSVQQSAGIASSE